MSMDSVSSDEVKAKARDFGADLVGIASAESLQDEPHPPSRVVKGVKSVVVMARRFMYGGVRLRDGTARTHHYATELGLTELEDAALRMTFYLEDAGYPSLMVPASGSRSKQEDMADHGPLSLTHAAVEAGLGTLGLNGMLLTREYGPRVILCAVLSHAELDPDHRMTKALCLGEECGRCLLVCPGNAVRHWELDVEACRPYSAPYDYPFFQEHVAKVANEPDPAKKWEIATSTDSLMIWQSMLRGVGIVTGCTRCQDVCPVGEDYEKYLADALDEMPEETEEKRAALAEMQERASSGGRGEAFERERRWIGKLDTE
jgi:epoxyqueuosine reductase